MTDNFAVLLKAEKEAAEIIQKARDARREIMRNYEVKLEQEVAKYKAEEGTRVRSTQGGGVVEGKTDEVNMSHTLKQIASQTNANMDSMVKKLTGMVTSVNQTGLPYLMTASGLLDWCSA